MNLLYLVLYIPQVIFLLWVFFALLSIVKGAPFIITKHKVRQSILDLASIKKGEKAADLGSGDGSILLLMAEQSAIVTGYEINYLLVLWSRLRIRKNGIHNSAGVKWSSFWKQDLSEYDLIYVYGIKNIMPDLEKKLQKELKVGARVISNVFTFPNWKIEKSENGVKLYIKRV